MARRGSVTDKGRSLNSIKLKDFPENAGLSDDFFDREYEDETDNDVSFVIPRSEISEDEDGTDGLTVSSVSRLFDEDDISAGDTTILSRDELDRYEETGETVHSGYDRPAGENAGEATEADEQEAQDTVPAPVKSKRKTAAPGKGQINRNPQAAKKAQPKKSKRQPKVRDFGTKRHSAAYRIIKFCIFLLLWIAVAFAAYQLYKFGYKVLNDQPMDSSDASKIQITVSGNETDAEMGEILLDNGLIDDVGIYKWRCMLYSSDYVPGTYKLSRSYNTEKILNILAGYTYSDGTMDEDESTSEEAAETVAAEDDEGGGDTADDEGYVDDDGYADDEGYADEGDYEGGGEDSYGEDDYDNEYHGDDDEEG